MVSPAVGADATAVPVWDPYVRIFHWLLVASMAAAWWSGETGRIDLHYQIGLFALGLVIFRVLWGLVGSPTARFAHFLKGPDAVIAYLRTFAARKPTHALGHNPGGGLMVAVLLLAVFVQSASGLFINDDILFEGPFYDNVSEAVARFMGFVHIQFFNLMLALVAAHVAVIALYFFWKRENLLRAMVTGRALLPVATASRANENGETRFASPFRALACIVLAAVVPLAIYWMN